MRQVIGGTGWAVPMALDFDESAPMCWFPLFPVMQVRIAALDYTRTDNLTFMNIPVQDAVLAAKKKIKTPKVQGLAHHPGLCHSN